MPTAPDTAIAIASFTAYLIDPSGFVSIAPAVLQYDARTLLNTFSLFLALQCWPMPACVPPGRAAAAITRLVGAVSIFAIEMQLATWLSLPALSGLVPLNVGTAVVSLVHARRRQMRLARSGGEAGVTAPAIYMLGIGLLAALVFTLNLMRPVLAADPYHLDRMTQIQELGSLAYDPDAEVKVNSFGWTYELVLADVGSIPIVGPALVRFHGLFGLAMYVLAVAAAVAWLPGGRDWYLLAMLAVPVVFHQLVLIKNDLFGALPALTVLAWLVTRSRTASFSEVAWAAWLCGFAIGTKLTSAPLTLVLAAALLLERDDRWSVIRAGAAGGLIGLLCGGFFFTLLENFRVYGSPIEAFRGSGGMGNRTATLPEAAISVVRFVISLFDLGLYTRDAWPGRGGWGSTFGLPLIWALVVLIHYRRMAIAHRALLMAFACMLVFAAIYTDADVAHRLVLGPGLLLIVAAIAVNDTEERFARWSRVALAVAVGLSALQIARSSMLYLP
jgi:hypothetical protein